MKHAPKGFAAFLRATAVLFAALAVWSTAFAQITVTNATFPVAGDTLKMAIDNAPPWAISVVYTPPGGPQSWNLSALEVDATKTLVFRPASQGTVGAQVPGAELFTVPSPNTEEYYNVTSTRFELQAYYGIQPYDIVSRALFRYQPPLVERRAPVNFFDINVASSGFLEKFPPSAFPPALIAAFPVHPDSLRYRVSVSRTDVVDGFGSITIPGGTYDVLREKRTMYTETRLDGRIPPLGWLDITDNAIQAGFNGLGVDTTVFFNYLNNVAKEVIASATLNNAQNAVTQVQFKYIRPPATDAVIAPEWRAQLQQNQPNPFNPTTAITFELARPGAVRCDVYDVHGRHVARLFDGFAPAGSSRVSWNGKSDHGTSMPSGVYQNRLQSEDWTLSRKMTLAR